ncbi:APC family permease [Oscillospiraceae bacterium HV4-5-C5C]|nr:APC family permease [Oscillospiraceae bacterium HV4-5-C5C]
MTLKELLIGKPLKSSDLKSEKLSRRWGLPIMASDAVSSVAYAVEEILLVLVPILGLGAFHYVPWVVVAILSLLIILIFSYAQIIQHYPNGGGAYIVSLENLGEKPALLAAAALVVDYIMTVAVSISAASMAILSAFPELDGYQVWISLFCILMLTLGNLRGMRESAKLFGTPTYLFIALMVLMIIAGFIRMATGHLEPIRYSSTQTILPLAAAPSVFVLLKAFSSGCSALTGVEAVSNAVPSFEEPSRKNAKQVLYMLGLVILVIFGGTTILATRLQVMPIDEMTVTAQMAKAIFGNTPLYYLIQAFTALILILAANTAYNGLPTLLHILAQDSYVPRQFEHRGAKLSFSNGILFISICASLLVIAFQSSPHRLIPMYSVGVFISFTLAQIGMLKKWHREKERGWQYKSLINAFGGIVTAVGAVIVFLSKFMEGAWMLAIVLPGLLVLMLAIKNHYNRVHEQLALPSLRPFYEYKGIVQRLNAVSLAAEKAKLPTVNVIILIQSINKATLKAINYAVSLTPHITAVHIASEPEHAQKLQEQWQQLEMPFPLEIIDAPYRDIITPLRQYVTERATKLGHGQTLTVILIKYVASRWYDRVLHNQTTYFMEHALSRYKNVVSILVPYHYNLKVTEEERAIREQDYRQALLKATGTEEDSQEKPGGPQAPEA